MTAPPTSPAPTASSRRWRSSIPQARSTRSSTSRRPADDRAGDDPRRAAPLRRSRLRDRDRRRRDREPGRPERSERRQADRHAGRREPAQRALLHARDRADGRRAALSPCRHLRLSPRGARPLRGAPPSPLETREKLEQLRALEAGMRIDAEIVDAAPLGVDMPHQLERPAASTSRRRAQTASRSRASRVPTPTPPAGRCIPARAAAVPDLRGCARGRHARRGGPCDDPDREHDRRPRRRHPPPPAVSGLQIVGEFFLPIRFQLMAKPGTGLADIREVHSHIHALGQCRGILRRNGWKPVISGDTAGAARIISQMAERDVAALAPRLAAELYGLDILAENVEDAEHNTTRFVVLSRPGRGEDLWAPRSGEMVSPPSSSRCATCRPRSTRRSAALPPTAST